MPILAIGFRNFRRHIARILFVDMADLDRNQIRSPDVLGGDDPIFELGDDRIPVLAPFPHKIQIINNFCNTLATFDFLELGFEETRGHPAHTTRFSSPLSERRQNLTAWFHFDNRRAFELLGHHIGDDRRRHEHQEKRQKDDTVSVLDDLPVIYGMKRCFTLLG
ncbi:hypothetical protein OVA24_07370 [Luteolibacter sp. SL250]|uniref:hypothetical protein n=1 Tax=Luteolibacter sp. SL250 TaxID=2995170 RepID=UPI00227027F9|nr:hypothetical protein [Luteolibacter sp. SL250]WAC21201.1 hypothetical protein OVA24_07370 [Luteolibacter sp. SL250]